MSNLSCQYPAPSDGKSACCRGCPEDCLLRDTAGIAPKIPEKREALPFDEMVAKDVLHLALDMAALAAMQSLMSVVIHNMLNPQLVIMSSL